MERYESMTFEQAMEHIACKDVYLKSQEDLDADWYDIDQSLHRAYLYHRWLGTIWERDTHQSAHKLQRVFDEQVFPITLVAGTDAWFQHLGAVFISIKSGRCGWMSSSHNCHRNMLVLETNLRFNDTTFNDFWETLDTHIRDGNTGLYVCDHCDQYCSNVTEIDNGDCYVCNNCLDYYSYDYYHDNWFTSDNAVNAIGPDGQDWTINNEGDTSDFTWDEDNDRYVHEDYHDEKCIIKEYHSHSYLYKKVDSAWTKANTRWFGVELEVECQRDRESIAEDISNWFDTNRSANERIFYEEDGSLSEGFEMISQPMGLDKHREIWKWVEQKELINGLRSHNTSTCGLHVHVSKEGLSSLTISKAVCFINNPSNVSLIRAIARRYNSGYCKAKHVTLANGNKNGDKYEMLNITKNSTLEFRIFRGSLNYNAIQAALEFSNAIINFVSATSMEDLNELMFLQFIYKPEQRMDTKFLRSYLEQRSSRIKDIIDRNVKPMFKLKVIKPEPVETTPDEPKIAPPPRNRGSSVRNVTFDELLGLNTTSIRAA